QIDNAVVAILLARALRGRGFAAIDDDVLAPGLAGARWPGRLDLYPAPDGNGPDLLLDGAHNPDGCAILAAYLERHQAHRRRVLLFAAMRDKPAGEMLRLLRPAAESLVLTSLAPPRGAAPA